MSRGYLFNIDTLQVYPNTRNYSMHSNDCVVIRHPQNLLERYGLRGMLEFADKLFEVHGSSTRVEPHWTSDELVSHIWDLFKEVDNELKVTKRAAQRAALREVPKESRGRGNYTPGPRRKRWPRTYKLNRQEVSEEFNPLRRSRVPGQARAILEAVRQQPLDVLTEDQMKEIILKAAENGIITTKQDPWRIFLYYECYLNRMGLLVRRIDREYKSHEDAGWTQRKTGRPAPSFKYPATEGQLQREALEKQEYLEKFR